MTASRQYWRKFPVCVKMEAVITLPHYGKIRKINAKVGGEVRSEQVFVEFA